MHMDSMKIGVKVEKPENYDGSKDCDLDTWFFQVQKHLQIIVIHVRGHVSYATSPLRGNATLWWRELVKQTTA